MQVEDEARKAEVHADGPRDDPGPHGRARVVAAPQGAEAQGAEAQGAGTQSGAGPSPPSSAPPASASPREASARALLRGFTRRSARLLEYLSVDPARRRRAAIVLAVALNTILFTGLAVFGRFEIWIPAAPRDSITITLVEAQAPPLLPDLRDPDTAPTPEPEPVVEPEIVEKPRIEPEPAPVPRPEPAPRERPKPPELEPDAVRPLDLTPKAEFTRPSPDDEAPFAGEPEPQPSEALALPSPGADVDNLTQDADASQTTAEESPPLVDLQPQPDAGDDARSADAGQAESEKKKDEGELLAGAASEPAPAAPANDDAFDEPTRFMRPRMPLPTVDLPEGRSAAAPGQSGVVAIFCPEEFQNKEKAAECAGRTEIRSGWRPGASGENWAEAIRLLKQDGVAGRAGTDPAAIFGPQQARAMKDAEAQEELKDFRRSAGPLNQLPGEGSANLDRTLSRPDIGPRDIDPSWTLRDDPNVSKKDVERLRRELEEAERRKTPPPKSN